MTKARYKLPHDDEALDDLSEFFADIDAAVPQATKNVKGEKRTVKYNRFKDDVFVEKLIQGQSATSINKEMGRNKSSGPPRNEYFRKRLAMRQAQLASDEAITSKRVLKEIAKIAFLDPRAFADDEGNPIPLHMLDDDAAAGLEGIEVHKLGKDQNWAEVVKYKLASKLGGLDKLMRNLNLYKADNDRDVNVDIREVSGNERARRVAFLLQEAMRGQQDGSDKES